MQVEKMLDEHEERAIQLRRVRQRQPNLRSVRLPPLDYGLAEHERKRKWVCK